MRGRAPARAPGRPRIDHDQPAAAPRPIRSCDPVVARLLERAVGDHQASVGRRPIALTACSGALAGPVEASRRAGRRRCAPRGRRARPRGRRRAGAERGDGAVEARDLGSLPRGAEAHDRARRRRPSRCRSPSVARSPASLELGDDLGVLEELVRLQRAVEHRHRDRGVAAAEDPVAELTQRVDHAAFPQRRSYWTKSGSASRACSGRSGCS